MYVLKPGDPEPATILSDTDSEHSRPSSAGSRPTSANRITRVVPSVKRKTTNNESDDKYLKDLSELNLSSSNEESTSKEMKVESIRECAPVELVTEFLACVMTREFTKAQSLCHKILEIEPENETCKEFAHVINIALAQENEEDSESSDDSESDSEISDDDSGLSDESEGENDDDDDDDDDEVSVSEDSDESEDDEDELSIDDVNKLNLLMGGIQIVKNT